MCNITELQRGSYLFILNYNYLIINILLFIRYCETVLNEIVTSSK
jgi:hypothetical protein